ALPSTDNVAVDTQIYADRLVDPTGRELVSPGWKDSPVCTACETRIAADVNWFFAMVPDRPDVALAEGQWSVEFALDPADDAALESLSRFVIVKVGPGAPLTGALSVGIHLASDLGFSAGSDEALALEQNMLTALNNVFEYASVTVSIVGTKDVGFSGPAVDHAGLKSVAATVTPFAQAVDVVVVSHLEGTDGVRLLGRSPVPGPPGGGAPVVVELADSGIGRTAAHEIAHYLGLWHTREGSRTDPLDDTPTFPSGNLMETTGTGFALTEQQGAIIRLHPLVTHTCDER
ncbi:MAG: hypothetical protein ACI9OJ_003049, partial [Myxococcota bacterium]